MLNAPAEHLKGFNFADVVASGDAISDRRDILSVLWAITKSCNFACSYCVYNKPVDKDGFSSEQDLIAGAETLLRMGRPGYQITLYGGEPTIHPGFLGLLKYLRAYYGLVQLRIYTNGSRSAKFHTAMAEAAGGQPIGVIFSLHPQFANFPRFLEGLRIAAEGGMSAAVSFMYDARYPDEARAYVAELLALRERVPFFVMLNLPYTRDGVMGGSCRSEDLAWLAEMQRTFDAMPTPPHLRSPFFVRITCALTLNANGRREVLPPEASLALLETLNTPSYTGFHCVSGANVLFIEEDGAVRGGVCDKSQPMGNIFTDTEIGIVQRMNTVRCTARSCNSIENIPLPKFRSEAEAQECLSGFRNRAKAYFYRAEAGRLRRASASR